MSDGATLLRLALAHGPGGLSLRSAAIWAGASGVAELSDVALRRRLRGAAGWLGQIAGALLTARLPSEHVVSTERLRIVDGSSISHAGADGTSWRLHAAYDPATACFTDLELTGPDGGEGFGRFSFSQGDLVVGDRGYAKPRGLQHVLTAGANFLVRVGWNSMRMITPDGERIDLAAIYDTLGPGETTELSVVVTRHSKGQGRRPRRLFPARLVIMRQREAAGERATKAAKRQHSKTRSNVALKPMTLTSANYPDGSDLVVAGGGNCRPGDGGVPPPLADRTGLQAIEVRPGSASARSSRSRNGPKLAAFASHSCANHRGRHRRSSRLSPCALCWRKAAGFPVAFARRFARRFDRGGCPNRISRGSEARGLRHHTPSL